MNGAESLVRTLVGGGVEVCFANPGTSEIHFVAALDAVRGMRGVLGLFEGVVTGAADGYWRMCGRPAATLLHLGPGLGNGIANLHNAKKAHSGVVNIIGEHALGHIEHDAPLTADIEGLARPVSHWVRTSTDARQVAIDGAEAITVATSPPGQIASLILPGDTAWNQGAGPAAVPPVAPRAVVADQRVESAAELLRAGDGTMLLVGGQAVRGRALTLAGAIAAKTGARLLAEGSNARMQRGAGRVPVNRLPYPVPQAVQTLADVQRLVLVGARTPVGFFGYPNQPSVLTPPDCQVYQLAAAAEDAVDALQRLADRVGATEQGAPLAAAELPGMPTGALDLDKLGAVVANAIPEQAIVVDESVTSGRRLAPLTFGAAPHDWLNNKGGSIGYGLPVATGAAVACPDRKVLALEGDGSAMYTPQALWTMAREALDVTILVCANRSYHILKGEFGNVGAGQPGARALDLIDIDRPAIDWCALAASMGVPAVRVDDAQALAGALATALAADGPYLIEAVL